MITRRGILFTAVAAPLLGFSGSPEIEILPEATLLSEESASGFKSILGSIVRNEIQGSNRPRIVVAPGFSNLRASRARNLRRQAELGAWIVLESGLCFSRPEQVVSQASLLKQFFGIELDLACSRSSSLYVSYEWPLRRLVRSFGSATPLRCPGRTIATSAGLPLCSLQRLGSGGIVFLGSMLGPSLFGEDRQAHLLCRSLLSELQVKCGGRPFGDTSTTACTSR